MKIILFTLTGLREERLALTTIPAMGNTRSDGLLVAGIHKMRLTNKDSNGNCTEIDFQNLRMSPLESCAFAWPDKNAVHSAVTCVSLLSGGTLCFPARLRR